MRWINAQNYAMQKLQHIYAKEQKVWRWMPIFILQSDLPGPGVSILAMTFPPPPAARRVMVAESWRGWELECGDFTMSAEHKQPMQELRTRNYLTTPDPSLSTYP